MSITENKVVVIKKPLHGPDFPRGVGGCQEVRCPPIAQLARSILGSSPVPQHIQQQLEKIKGLFHFFC